MGPRVRRHAEILLDADDVDAGDQVAITAGVAAEDLVVALHESCGERDVRPVWLADSSRATRAFVRGSRGEFELHEHELALMESCDATIFVEAPRNTAELADVPSETMGEYAVAQRPITVSAMACPWTVTKHPTSAAAQKAGMSSEASADFVYDAVNKDWDAQDAFQAQMVDLRDDASEVRIVAGDTTDISMSVEGMVAENDTCTNNVPGVEVFTAPFPIASRVT